MNDASPSIYEFEGFRLSPAERKLTFDSETIALPDKALSTLCVLVQNAGHLVTKDDLMQAVWGDTTVEENNLDQKISLLRRTLARYASTDAPFIETVRGYGYRFVVEVTERNEKVIVSAVSESPADPASGVDKKHRSFGTNAAVAILLLLIAFGATAFYLNRLNTSGPKDGKPSSIAILPFQPLVPGERDEAIEIGMADALITRLSQNPSVSVIPLSSTRRFANGEVDSIQAGRTLGTNFVLDGSMHRSGERLRVRAQLSRVSDNTVVWAETFDETVTDIFDVQDEIARRIEAALVVGLAASDARSVETRYTNNAQAFEYFQRARFHSVRINPHELEVAIDFYQRAIEADPQYALAFAGLAEAHRVRCIAGFVTPRLSCVKAREFAERALAADPSLTDAQIVLAWIDLLYDRDWKRAEERFKAATLREPNNFEAHRGYSHLLSNLGRNEEALSEITTARQLSPLTLITGSLEAQYLLFARRYDEALERVEKVLADDPGFWHALLTKGRILTFQKRYDEAIEVLEKARVAAPGAAENLQHLGYVLALAGRKKEAAETLADLKRSSDANFSCYYGIAVVNAALGNTDSAVESLQRSIETREPQVVFLKTDIRWDDLRSDPRFQKAYELTGF